MKYSFWNWAKLGWSVLNRFIFFHFPWAFPWFLELICWVLCRQWFDGRSYTIICFLSCCHQMAAVGFSPHQISDPLWCGSPKVKESQVNFPWFLKVDSQRLSTWKKWLKWCWVLMSWVSIQIRDLDNYSSQMIHSSVSRSLVNPRLIISLGCESRVAQWKRVLGFNLHQRNFFWNWILFVFSWRIEILFQKQNVTDWHRDRREDLDLYSSKYSFIG